CSRKISAVSKSNKTGVIVIETALFMGVERFNPLKNISIFNTIPKMAHAIIRNQSPGAIFSDFENALTIQKSNAAPPTLKTIKPNGWIIWGIRPLATVWFIPYMVSVAVAASMANIRLSINWDELIFWLRQRFLGCSL